MKAKYYLALFSTVATFSFSFAQSTFYIPGTGTSVKKLQFETAAQLTEKFNYGGGWAGTGFGLTGTQRGAPEIIATIANPKMVSGAGNQVLSFRSKTRDANWHTENPSAVGQVYYGVADQEAQDDFFMTGAAWLPAETPSVMMHVYIPEYTSSNEIITSLRMPILYTNSNGASEPSWPGVWCHGSFFVLRGPGRNDILQDTNAPNGGKDTWWTFGVSIAPDGDIQYYATPSYVTQLTKEHLVGVNSIVSAETRALVANPQNYLYYPVLKSNDAIIMSSNINTTSENTLIDNLFYTKGTTQVLSLKENKLLSVTLYPNPTSQYLFVDGMQKTTPYKIVDNAGRIITNGNISIQSNTIDVVTLKKGVYYLVLKGYKTSKFIKK